MLLLTVTAGMGMGANLDKVVFAKVTREPDGFSARVVSFVAIHSCSSIRNPKLEVLPGKRCHWEPGSRCEGCGATLAIP